MEQWNLLAYNETISMVDVYICGMFQEVFHLIYYFARIDRNISKILLQ